MSLIGLGLIGWRIEDPAFNPFGFPGNDFLRGGTAAVLFVLLVVALTALSFRSMATVRRSARMIQTALGPLTPARIILLASLSGIGEELLFRGWLLNETGLLVSSIIFGAFHIRWDRDLIYWPFFAFAVGLVLGLFCLWTNTLYWAVLVHAGINGLNLYQISRQDRSYARRPTAGTPIR